jgi:sortase A
MVEASDAPMLTLVTCYPFDAIVPGGPLRYVVTAVARTVAADGAPPGGS